MPQVTNGERITATTLDAELFFNRPILQDTKITVEVISGTMKYAVGENSNNSSDLWTSGEIANFTVGHKPIDRLHYSASSLVAVFRVTW